MKIKKTYRKVLVFMLTLCVTVMLIPTIAVNAEGTYKLTFGSDKGYTLEVDGSSINVKKGGNSVDHISVVGLDNDTQIAEYAQDGDKVVASVAVGTKVKIRFDSNACSIFEGGHPIKVEQQYSNEANFNVQDPDGGGGNPNLPNPPAVTNNVTVNGTATGGVFDRIKVNNVDFVEDHTHGGLANVNVTKAVEKKDIDTLEITPDFGNAITELKVNGQNITITDSDKNGVTLNLAHADTYTIAMKCGPAAIGSIAWAYDEAHNSYGPDALVEHAKVEIVFVKIPNSNEPISADQLRHNVPPVVPFLNDDNYGGMLWVPSGSQVTLKIVPEVGYQVVKTALNGQTGLSPDADTVAQYTVKVDRPLHLGGLVQKTDDKVSAETAKIKSGSLALEAGENAITMGTAKLTIVDHDLTPDQLSKFKEAAGAYTIKDSFDIKLAQTVYQGSADHTWYSNIENLSKGAKITLKLTENMNGNDIVVVHEKKDGTMEVIPAEYNSADNTITFTATSFSDYAIAAKPTKVTPITLTFKAGKNCNVSLNTYNVKVQTPSTGSDFKDVNVLNAADDKIIDQSGGSFAWVPDDNGTVKAVITSASSVKLKYDSKTCTPYVDGKAIDQNTVLNADTTIVLCDKDTMPANDGNV